MLERFRNMTQLQRFFTVILTGLLIVITFITAGLVFGLKAVFTFIMLLLLLVAVLLLLYLIWLVCE